MYLIREVFYCKPGKVRPLVEKFLAMGKLNAKFGMPPMKIMTDFCAEQYWTSYPRWRSKTSPRSRT